MTIENIPFKIDMNRVLDILTKEIYDSPFALLRENIQNAYDAILMRQEYSKRKWSLVNKGIIEIKIDDEKISIKDNGIGMPISVIKNNYWSAGSSGKNTELAKRSGVIGTFGIGGMANFGVCKKLRIETESIETKTRIITEVEKNELSLTEENITIKIETALKDYGTKIIAYLDNDIEIDINKAKEYIFPYVQYLPVKVYLNDELISGITVENAYVDTSARIQVNIPNYKQQNIEADIAFQCNDTPRASIQMKNIKISNENVKGEIYLRQDIGHIWGLRSNFGLATVPVRSHYNFGGIVNLEVLVPTAGREALSRESINLITSLISFAEQCTSEILSKDSVSQRSGSFISHISSTKQIHFAENLLIRTEPEKTLTLGQIKNFSTSRVYKYYEGSDEDTIKSLGQPDSILIVLSRTNPRRKIEIQYLTKYCQTVKVADKPRAGPIFDENELRLDELSFIFRATQVLQQDYLMVNFDIKYADITHKVPVLIDSTEKETLRIYIQRNSDAISSILQIYSQSRELFTALIRDYIRVYLYPRIKNWVPSSTREGADALQKILMQKRELFQIEYDDVGLASLLNDFLDQKVKMKKILDTARKIKIGQTQEITRSNIGKIENEIPDLVDNPIIVPEVDKNISVFLSSPPIDRKETNTTKKLLIVDEDNNFLNNFKMFLAVSDKSFREEYDFFIAPHRTRIIWGGRRIIFILTHASGNFSLYYDIELLKEEENLAGGGMYFTTTIISKNRIYLPVPEDLEKIFNVRRGGRKKEFYVRFDTI